MMIVKTVYSNGNGNNINENSTSNDAKTNSNNEHDSHQHSSSAPATTNESLNALYQHYSQQNELSEDKRQMLREIESQAIKYMDDLESGRVQRNQNQTIQGAT